MEEDDPAVRFRVVIGVFHSPEEFVARALETVHPLDWRDVSPDSLKRRMHEAPLVRGPAWVQQSRAKLLGTWLRWAKQGSV